MARSARRHVSAIMRTAVPREFETKNPRDKPKLTRLNGIVSLGSFSGQHHTICTIKNGIGNITDFCPGRTRVILPTALSQR